MFSPLVWRSLCGGAVVALWTLLAAQAATAQTSQQQPAPNMGRGRVQGIADTAAPSPARKRSSRDYPLRHAQASEVEQIVKQALAALPERVDVVVDPRRNRLLVYGSASAHALVTRVVASVDKPPPAAAGGGPVLASYAAEGAELDAKADALRRRFGDFGVRVALDRRRSQLLVVAPRALQAQIAQYLRGWAAAGNGGGAVPAQFEAPAESHTGVLPRERGHGQLLRLQNAPQPTIEALAQLWGNRMTRASSQPHLQVFNVTLPDRRMLRIQFEAGQVRVLGPGDAVYHCTQLLAALDRPQELASGKAEIVPIRNAEGAKIRKAVDTLRAAGADGGQGLGVWRLRGARRDGQGAAGGDFVGMLFQKNGGAVAQQNPEAAQQQPPAGGQPPAQPGQPGAGRVEGGAGFIGPIQLEVLEDLGVVIIRGPQADVAKLRQLIEDIETISEETEPLVEVLPIKNVNGEALAAIVGQLYDSVYVNRRGRVSITPLVQPNALLVVGQEASVEAVKKLVARLDQPAVAGAQFQVFKLKYMSALAAEQMVLAFYGAEQGPDFETQQQRQDPPALFPRIHAIADVRTNSLVVRGSRNDLAEIGRLLDEADRSDSASELTVQIFQLRNSLAEELAAVLQAAILGQTSAPGQVGQVPAAAAQQPGQQPAGAQANFVQQRSAVLRMVTLDAEQKRVLRSGILADVQVVPDARANALLVKAPEETMGLIAELIGQLDQIPGAVSQIKVFTIVNGVAENLVTMLEALFGAAQEGGAAGQFGAQAAGAVQGESSLVPLRFAVDTRTNSIIASGSTNDLLVVHAILLRLDESDVAQRETKVYRLKNAPALDVADAITLFLQSERSVQELGPQSAFQQIQQEVVVVAEPVTNSLILSATARFFEEIEAVIEDLDRKPPMVMIQVLIAEVGLNNTDEFGVELGLQDSILFDRSIIDDLLTIESSSQTAASTVTNQQIISQSAQPGFNFNNQPLGLNPAINRENTAGQAITNFAVGRLNTELGYGGLVLSASSESVSILIRALQECRRLDVLARPQIMTLDNQPAYVQVGERVQRITSSTFNAETGATTNQVGPDEPVGLILAVTPRVSPDGLVAMEIDVENSELGPEAQGVPISVNPSGDVIRSPNIETITAQTTVSAISGQTIVLGGLITKRRSTVHRRVPILASVPILGHLFRYDADVQERGELLIIMTPHVIRDEADAEWLKQVEVARMSMVLSDVQKLHGDIGVRRQAIMDSNILTIYPDSNPRGVIRESVPPGVPALPQPAGPQPAEPQPAGPQPIDPPPVRPGGAQPAESGTAPGSAAGGQPAGEVAPPPVAPQPQSSDESAEAAPDRSRLRLLLPHGPELRSQGQPITPDVTRHGWGGGVTPASYVEPLGGRYLQRTSGAKPLEFANTGRRVDSHVPPQQRQPRQPPGGPAPPPPQRKRLPWESVPSSEPLDLNDYEPPRLLPTAQRSWPQQLPAAGVSYR